MKTFARVLTLILAIAMVCSLVGCKPAGNTPGGGGEEQISLNGKKVKIAAWFETVPKKDAITEKERLMASQYEEAMAKYNFEFEEIIVNQLDIKTNFEAALMSGDVWADIITMRSEQADVFAAKGNFKDVSGLMSFDSPDFDYNQDVRARYTKNGKTYAWSFDIYWLSSILFYNKDVMDRQGLAYPTKVFNEGNWTWDKFVEYVQKSTIKESDGYVNTYGLYATYETGYVDNYVVSAIGKSMVYFGDDGKVVYGANDNEYQAMANRVRDLFMSEYCYKPAKGTSIWSDMPEKFINGKVAFYPTSMAGGPDALNTADFTDWGIVPFPVLNKGDEFRTSVGTINVRFMPAALDDDWAKKVATVYEATFKSPYAEADRAASNKSDVEVKVPDKDSVDLVYKYQYVDIPKQTFFAKYVLDDSVFYHNIEVPFQEAMKGENTIAATIAGSENVFKSLIADYNATFE